MNDVPFLYEHPLEFRLLSACLRPESLAVRSESLHLILDKSGLQVDGENLLNLAVRHKMIPQLHLSLQDVPDELLPQKFRKMLAERFTASVQRNLIYSAELLRLAKSLEEAGIPILCVKGPVLAQELYGGLEQRQYADLDLLVRPNDLRAACDLLEKESYRWRFARTANISDRQFRRNARLNQEMPFQKSGEGLDFYVDLHWRLANGPAFKMSVEQLFTEPHNIKIGGRTIHTMSHRDLIAYLAHHGSYHRWRRLHWLCAFARLLHSFPREEWDDLRRHSASFGPDRFFMTGLAILKDLHVIDQPEEHVPSFANARAELHRVLHAVHRDLDSRDEPPAFRLNSLAEQTVWHAQFTGRSTELIRYPAARLADWASKASIWLRNSRIERGEK
jgi:hypothetical protein